MIKVSNDPKKRKCNKCSGTGLGRVIAYYVSLGEPIKEVKSFRCSYCKGTGDADYYNNHTKEILK